MAISVRDCTLIATTCKDIGWMRVMTELFSSKVMKCILFKSLITNWMNRLLSQKSHSANGASSNTYQAWIWNPSWHFPCWRCINWSESLSSRTPTTKYTSPQTTDGSNSKPNTQLPLCSTTSIMWWWAFILFITPHFCYSIKMVGLAVCFSKFSKSSFLQSSSVQRISERMCTESTKWKNVIQMCVMIRTEMENGGL